MLVRRTGHFERGLDDQVEEFKNVINGNIEADNIKAGSILFASLAAEVYDAIWEIGSVREWPHNTLPVNGTWLYLEGGTIGDASSNASVLADTDAETLFGLFWSEATDTSCPMLLSDGSASARGASAAADWAAHKQLTLPDTRDRFFRGLSGSRTLWDYQADAFQGFKMDTSNTNGLYHQNVLTSGSANVVRTVSGGTKIYLDTFLSDGVNGTPRTADETRPKNLTMRWIIRY